jgi:hypothetical protein
MYTTRLILSKALYILCYFSIICFFESCIPKDHTESRFIKIVNNSNQNLIFVLSENDKFEKPIYHDQVLYLKSQSSDSLTCSESYFSWENMIEQTNNKKINIYIVQKSSLDKFDGIIDSVFSKNEYLKKCSFDIEFIEKNNWKIVFK